MPRPVAFNSPKSRGDLTGCALHTPRGLEPQTGIDVRVEAAFTLPFCQRVFAMSRGLSVILGELNGKSSSVPAAVSTAPTREGPAAHLADGATVLCQLLPDGCTQQRHGGFSRPESRFVGPRFHGRPGHRQVYSRACPGTLVSRPLDPAPLGSVSTAQLWPAVTRTGESTARYAKPM